MEHHGGCSGVANQSGGSIIGRAQYLPLGALRGNTPRYLADVTSKGFTGHQENAYIKLLYTKTSCPICDLTREKWTREEGTVHF